MNDVRIACCWVEQKALIVIPIPDAVIRKRIEEAKKNAKEPLKGTSYIHNAMGVISNRVTICIKKHGIVFPRISSILDIGATINCSIVPISFSRTITALVRTIDMARMISTTTPGTKNSLELRLGLNQAREAS